MLTAISDVLHYQQEQLNSHLQDLAGTVFLETLITVCTANLPPSDYILCEELLPLIGLIH